MGTVFRCMVMENIYWGWGGNGADFPYRSLFNHQRIPWHWEVPGFKRGPRHLRTNWRSTVNKNLLRMGITWEEVEVAAQNRSE